MTAVHNVYDSTDNSMLILKVHLMLLPAVDIGIHVGHNYEK